MQNKKFNQLFHSSANFEICNLLLAVGEQRQQQQKLQLYKHCRQFLKLAKTPVTLKQLNIQSSSQITDFSAGQSQLVISC